MEKKTDRQMPARELLKRFAPYFIKYKGMLLFDLFCAALTTVCEIVFPLIVRAVTNRAMTSPEEITVPWVLMLGLLYLALRVIDAAGAYWMQSRGHFMGARIERDMRGDLFEHLQKLSFTFYNNTKIGQLMARLTSELSGLFAQSHRLEEEIRARLGAIGYEI